MNFGQNLKKVRTERGISQEELAKSAGVHSVQFSRYERGQSAPSIEVVQKIAQTLEISIDQLVFGDQDEVSEKSIQDRELLELFKKVQGFNDRQKGTVKDLISAFILKADLTQKLAQ